MKVYVFGNEDFKEDNLAFEVAKKLKCTVDNVQFIIVKPNEDLPFADEENVVLMDTVLGIDRVKVLTEKDLDKIVLSPKNTVHDFDLSFQLRYLKKLEKIKKVKIIALPQKRKINYGLIQSIFKKLVAQDMQGS